MEVAGKREIRGGESPIPSPVFKSLKGGMVGAGSGADVGAELERVRRDRVGGETGLDAKA